MPMLDMPLEELRIYLGRNPRPPEFDEYWERAISEMRGTDPAVQMERSEFQVPGTECFDLYFRGVRGGRVHAQLMRPTDLDAPRPTVLQFHGYSGSAGDWSHKLLYRALGFNVIAMDCRGQGGSSWDAGGVIGNTYHGHIIRGLDDEPDNLLFRQIFLDTAELAAVAMAMDEVDESRVAAVGGSQGGGLALACAALEQRVRAVVPQVPFLCDYQRVWEMDLAKRAYQELTDYFRRFDPLHAREDAVFARLGFIDVQHLAERIQGSVLFGTGLMDEVCPPSSQFGAYNKIVAPKEMMVYPDFGHEALPGFQDRAVQFLLDAFS